MQWNDPESVRLTEDDRLIIIDQTLLPNRLEYLELRTADEMYNAILRLKVRGAPAIGICAAYSLYVLSKQMDTEDRDELLSALDRAAGHLNSSRPTAVNLGWALKRLLSAARTCPSSQVSHIRAVLRDEALAIHREDIAMCRAIAEHGLSLLKPGDGVLTHCNAGPLATSRYGTALGPILLAKEQNFPLRVFADETRPLLQGARLTAWELDRAGVDITLICDNMASLVMKNGWVQACFVGCDRVAANGDTANKIGTSGVAILARHYGIPFYVLGPTSTIDMACPNGDGIPIEERPAGEIREAWYTAPMAPEGISCYNPAFDVTDHELITAIVTEKGICYPPFSHSLAELFQ